MKRITESFKEVVAGDPKKEHYINVSLVVMSLSIIIGLFMVITKIGQ